MRVLVGCEFSQIVCMAFRAKGHEAFSCDLLPCEGGHPEWHIQGDVLEAVKMGWDMAIFHPPCTYLSYVGMRHWNKPGRAEKRRDAMKFFMQLVDSDIPRIGTENPLGYPCQVYRAPDQVIHPYYFGEPKQKRICLWLKNLPPLQYRLHDELFGPRTAVDKPEPMYICQGKKCFGKKIHWVEGIRSGSKNRSHERSRFFVSIANAMAEQWGNLPKIHLDTQFA